MIKTAQRIAASIWFERSIISLILLTALLLGLEAFPQIMSASLQARFDLAHDVILGAFIVEAAIKIIAAAPRPWNYFKNGWNIFDFSLIVLSLLPAAGQFALLGRILRLLLKKSWLSETMQSTTWNIQNKKLNRFMIIVLYLV